jgi:hypothetical protein
MRDLRGPEKMNDTCGEMMYKGFIALPNTPKYSVCLDKRYCPTMEFQVEQLLVLVYTCAPIHLQVVQLSSFSET